MLLALSSCSMFFGNNEERTFQARVLAKEKNRIAFVTKQPMKRQLVALTLRREFEVNLSTSDLSQEEGLRNMPYVMEFIDSQHRSVLCHEYAALRYLQH